MSLWINEKHNSLGRKDVYSSHNGTICTIDFLDGFLLRQPLMVEEADCLCRYGGVKSMSVFITKKRKKNYIDKGKWKFYSSNGEKK